jgi:hypothetical protein
MQFVDSMAISAESMRRLEELRNRKLPWIFNPAAWRARHARTHFRRVAQQQKQAIVEGILARRSTSRALSAFCRCAQDAASPLDPGRRPADESGLDAACL